MRRRFDSLAVVEAAYGSAASDAEWMRRISEAAAPGIDQGLGVASVYWRVGAKGVEPRAVEGPIASDLRAFVPRTYAGLPPEFVARAFSGPPWAARVSDLGPVHALLLEHAGRDGFDVGDVVAAQVGDGRGRGITIGAMASKIGTLDSHGRRTWIRVMAHVGAALRLRGRMEDAEALRADAVLDPLGRVQHAEGALRDDVPMRDALTSAVQRMERARGRMRRLEPDDALGAWTALVEGTWSVVDWVDTDGRRYLVAHENQLKPSDRRSLSLREREVAEYLAHGRTNAEIAYALGLSEGNMSRLVRTVLRKLGKARRSDLAMFFAAPDALALGRSDGDESLVALRPSERQNASWEVLTQAQRHVAELAISGASNEEIARARSTSVRTIANQLARIYRSLGVGSRNELAALLGPRRPELRPSK